MLKTFRPVLCSWYPLTPYQQRPGKTKGGSNAKLSMLVNLAGLPLSMKLACGNEHDFKSAIDILRGFFGGNFVLSYALQCF